MKTKFNLYGQNGAIVAVDHVMQKSCGLVAVGEVITGVLIKGDMVGIITEEKDVLYDKVKRLEINYEEVEIVEQGQQIGVCLDNITKEDLIDYFRW